MSARKPAPKPQKYFTLPEAAQHMRVAPDTIERAIHSGRLRAKKSGANGGGKYLISGDALDAWFEGLVDA